MNKISHDLSRIKYDIIEEGWCHLKNVSPDEFHYILKELGVLISKSDIKENDESTKFIHSDGGVQYHTDDPLADIIGWYCMSPAEDGGESLFLNINDVMSTLDSWSKNWLKRITFTVRHPVRGTFVTPFIKRLDNEITKYYYQPWRIFETLTPEKKEALFYFQNNLKNIIPHSILLQKHDILFLNNTFMLHGRKKFVGGNRHLKRYLLKWE